MLITLANFKTYAGIAGTDDDGALNIILAAVDGFIKDRIGRPIEKATYAGERHDGARFIRLKDRPVTSLTRPQYNTGTLSAPVWADFGDNDYFLHADQGVVEFSTIFEGTANVNFPSYEAGYGADAIPQDLAMLALRLSQRLYNRRRSEGVSGESLEGVSMQWDKLLQEEDLLTINQHKNFFV